MEGFFVTLAKEVPECHALGPARALLRYIRSGECSGGLEQIIQVIELHVAVYERL
jgi:hypothetical protein